MDEDDTKKVCEGVIYNNLPPYVGCWLVSTNLQIPLYGKKPNWFHRKMTTLLLGWKWIDGVE